MAHISSFGNERSQTLGILAEALVEEQEVNAVLNTGVAVNVRGGCEMKSANASGLMPADTFGHQVHSVHLKIEKCLQKLQRHGMTIQDIQDAMRKMGLEVPEHYLAVAA